MGPDHPDTLLSGLQLALLILHLQKAEASTVNGDGNNIYSDSTYIHEYYVHTYFMYIQFRYACRWGGRQTTGGRRFDPGSGCRSSKMFRFENNTSFI